MQSRRRPEALREPHVDPTDIDRLILSHLGIVRHMAKRFKGTVPHSVNVADLESAGRLGLVRAAHTWNAARGVTFSYYSKFRIRGAMLDELRSLDHVKRRSRKIAKGLVPPEKIPLGNTDPEDRRERPDPITHHEFPDGLVRDLDDRERKILHLRYTNDLGFSEIGLHMGVSASRVCQIHASLIGKARSYYTGIGISLRA